MVMYCDACDYIYVEKNGDPMSDVAPGTSWENLPEEWECPFCGLQKFAFVEFR